LILKRLNMENPESFIQTRGPLFETVQSTGVFDDSKTFVDVVPRFSPDEIAKDFEARRNTPGFDLRSFVETHFLLPDEGEEAEVKKTHSMAEHIEYLWHQLRREPAKDHSAYSTLLALPRPYIVPGGRFREIYYWDSYFTSLGLAVSGHTELVENMTDNFAWLIDKVGHIPNGNRIYYKSRSQPPFFSKLVELLVKIKPEVNPEDYLSQLKQEYAFWMDGEDKISGQNPSFRRLVRVHGNPLNRYFDDYPEPRQESYIEDVETARGHSNPSDIYLHLRAGAESGWDFSSRWLADKDDLQSIQTTHICPVDLNALLFNLESKLAAWAKKEADQQYYVERARQRQLIFNQIFWNREEQFYYDYHWVDEKQTSVISAAAFYPLYVGLADQYQADCVARKAEQELLEDGGLATTNVQTGQQWDYPNGWAPLQWIATEGLKKYGHKELAREIARRWLNIHRSVFAESGKMMEKYNVADLSLKAGGGEYPLQDGFGWTNGVALALIKEFEKEN